MKLARTKLRWKKLNSTDIIQIRHITYNVKQNKFAKNRQGYLTELTELNMANFFKLFFFWLGSEQRISSESIMSESRARYLLCWCIIVYHVVILANNTALTRRTSNLIQGGVRSFSNSNCRCRFKLNAELYCGTNS